MKQVIVVNRSLALPKGKLAAQAAHAAVGAFIAAIEQSQVAWLQVGMPKIVAYAADADVLILLEARGGAQYWPALYIDLREALDDGHRKRIGIGGGPVSPLSNKLRPAQAPAHLPYRR